MLHSHSQAVLHRASCSFKAANAWQRQGAQQNIDHRQSTQTIVSGHSLQTKHRVLHFMPHTIATHGINTSTGSAKPPSLSKPCSHELASVCIPVYMIDVCTDLLDFGMQVLCVGWLFLLCQFIVVVCRPWFHT